MKKTLCIILMFCGVLTLNAQTITVNKSTQIIENGFHPVFNIDGDMLLYSTENYVGLHVYKFADQSSVQINDEQAGGFSPIFSNDSKRVFYKNSIYDSRLRSVGIMSFNLQTKERTQLLQPKRNVKQAIAYQNGVMVSADNQIFKATFGKSTAKLPEYVWSDGVNLNAFVNGKTIVLNPIENANGYIWASVSPDQTKVLFTAPGSGTYVSDLKGKILYNLGYLNAPVWYDNKYVVGMQDKDDGHNITSSTVLIQSLDGKISQVLSDSKQIALYPAAASKANKVAYCTADGKIIVLEISIK